MSTLTVYQNRLKAIRLQTARTLTVRFNKLGSYDRPDAERFARTAIPVVAAGQMLAAKTTAAYVSRLAGIAPPALDRAAIVGARRNADPFDTYQRPFGMVWKSLGDGMPLADAVTVGSGRLNDIALADVWLASRAATEQIDAATPKITGWVRDADATACDLCSAADGMDMSAAADMAGHPGCGCTSRPTFADSPESQPADPEAIAVHEHDELGPVLYEAGQHFAA